MGLIGRLEQVEEADLTGVLPFNVNVANDDTYFRPRKGDGESAAKIDGGGMGGNSIADVVNSYRWYGGKLATAEALARIPRGFITEHQQILSSLLSGALYYINTVINTASKGANAAAETDFGKKIKGYLSKVQAVDNLSAKLRQKLAEFQSFQANEKELLSANNLNSLLGIYLTEPTEFNYVFPYLNGNYDTGGSWNDEGEGGFIQGLVTGGMKIVDEIAKGVNIMSPGVYIQKPKYFNFDQGGKEVTFEFPLFNTVGDATNYKDNYELLWLLTYQNKPYKTSFARTLPGKIYNVVIPGIASMPYAYLSNLSINFKGTTRLLPVSTPPGSTYKAPIPDAYVVKVTFTSLLNDYANTMVGSQATTDLTPYGSTLERAINSVPAGGDFYQNFGNAGSNGNIA